MDLYVDNDTVLKVTGLKSAASGGTYVNDATVQAKVYDETRVTVIATITLSYVAASNGNYEGTLPYSTVLVKGTNYWINYIVSGTAHASWWEKAKGKERS